MLEPFRQRGGVAGVEHGIELPYQVVGSVQFRTVLEQPPECLGGVQVTLTVGVELSSDRLLVELSSTRRWFGLCHEGIEPVDVLTLWLLAAASVVSVALFTVRGFLDQLREVFAAWHRARRAIRGDVDDE
ncbi:hypothetical protein ACWD7F_25570 [Streptomyces sp. NPDC005122]